MLNNWLTTVSNNKVSSYFTETFHDKDHFPNLENAKIVVFTTHSSFTDLVRLKLNALFNHFSTPIIDIGNLNTKNTSSIYQVVSELQDGYIIPVLMGIDQNAFLEFCNAMNLENKLELAAYISNSALTPSGEYAIENIGYQRHLIPKYILEEINESQTPGLSLGTMRSYSKIVEPILREVSYLHFDLAALRKADCPSKTNALPTGMYAEEACQIMRYAGEGMRLKLVTFETTDFDETSETEAQLLAELIWYLHEGVEFKPQDHPAI
ncbi:MAG: hypothetical protein P1U56_07655, partial [Saprospiraceae bacterium]|nr:hypothetical protein [Saprospiraceae bacterium]